MGFRVDGPKDEGMRRGVLAKGVGEMFDCSAVDEGGWVGGEEPAIDQDCVFNAGKAEDGDGEGKCGSGKQGREAVAVAFDFFEWVTDVVVPGRTDVGRRGARAVWDGSDRQDLIAGLPKAHFDVGVGNEFAGAVAQEVRQDALRKFGLGGGGPWFAGIVEEHERCGVAQYTARADWSNAGRWDFGGTST